MRRPGLLPRLRVSLRLRMSGRRVVRLLSRGRLSLAVHEVAFDARPSRALNVVAVRTTASRKLVTLSGIRAANEQGRGSARTHDRADRRLHATHQCRSEREHHSYAADGGARLRMFGLSDRPGSMFCHVLLVRAHPRFTCKCNIGEYPVNAVKTRASEFCARSYQGAVTPLTPRALK